VLALYDYLSAILFGIILPDYNSEQGTV